MTLSLDAKANDVVRNYVSARLGLSCRSFYSPCLVATVSMVIIVAAASVVTPFLELWLHTTVVWKAKWIKYSSNEYLCQIQSVSAIVVVYLCKHFYLKCIILWASQFAFFQRLFVESKTRDRETEGARGRQRFRFENLHSEWAVNHCYDWMFAFANGKSRKEKDGM